MAKIRPPSPDKTRQYRGKLPSNQRRPFDALVRLIDAPRGDLPWHHEVGRLAGQLRSEPAPGTTWSDLAEALGLSEEVLQKSMRFAWEYPAPKDFQELEEAGVDWTRLYIAFAVRDRQKRHALLRRAARENWPNPRLRAAIQQRFPTGRVGIGGRPRRKREGLGPEAALRELQRQGRQWLELYEQAWLPVGDDQWARLVERWPAKEVEKLVELLEGADETARQLQEAARVVRDTLAALRRQARQR
jgi:hypothetical protein